MAALTGDFLAVLEISGGTFDRLIASMHQNAIVDPTRPTLPHLVYCRLGDGSGQDSPKGAVAAQVGAPHLVLLDGAEDRFRIEVSLRAHYRPDPGSARLADVIHGTVSAEYRLQNLGDCWGWRDIADDYLWMEVDPDSVSFEGTAYDDSTGLAISSIFDEEAVIHEVNKQLAKLLATQFRPAPQPIAEAFRYGARCLVTGPGPSESAVAFPIQPGGGAPSGQVSSIRELFLGPRDFAVAVSSEAIITSLQPELDPLVGVQRDLHIHGDAGVGGGLEVDYHVRLDAAGAEWLGPSTWVAGPDVGAVRVQIDGSGWASYLYRSGIYNLGSVSLDDLAMTFAASQSVLLSFEAASGRLIAITPSPPSVSVNYGGPFSDEVKASVANEITAEVQARLGTALGQAQAHMSSLTSADQLGPLSDQLRRIDSAGNARFTDAVFRDDGLVIRGVISLRTLEAPQVVFDKTPAADGFDAILSWIPGGRVEAFEWNWRWFTNGSQLPPGPAGSRVEMHDFRLRRPSRGTTRFGRNLFGSDPLPGIDGSGSICLTISGHRVESQSGSMVPVESVIECEQFGYELSIPVEVAPLVTLYDPASPREDSPAREFAVVRAGAPAPRLASNTLFLHLGSAWDAGLIETLETALAGSRAYGAGLLVVLLFDDGYLETAPQATRDAVGEVSMRLDAPVIVTDNRDQGWSRFLALSSRDSDIAWRLLDPHGTFAWFHDGPVELGELIGVLNDRLKASPPFGYTSFKPGISLGDRLSIDLAFPPCPPVPLGSAFNESRLHFILGDHPSFVTQLEELTRDAEGSTSDGVFAAAVVLGSDRPEIERLQTEVGEELLLVPDPDGALTRSAGVRLWPTTMRLDGQARLVAVESGRRDDGGAPRLS